MPEEQRTSWTPVTDGDETEGQDAAPRDPEQLRQDIEETREELGDTVEALAAKTDVKAQAKRKADEIKASAVETKEKLVGTAREASPDSAASAASQVSDTARRNPLPVAAAAAFLTGFAAGRITKR